MKLIPATFKKAKTFINPKSTNLRAGDSGYFTDSGRLYATDGCCMVAFSLDEGEEVPLRTPDDKYISRKSVATTLLQGWVDCADGRPAFDISGVATHLQMNVTHGRRGSQVVGEEYVLVQEPDTGLNIYFDASYLKKVQALAPKTQMRMRIGFAVPGDARTATGVIDNIEDTVVIIRPIDPKSTELIPNTPEAIKKETDRLLKGEREIAAMFGVRLKEAPTILASEAAAEADAPKEILVMRCNECGHHEKHVGTAKEIEALMAEYLMDMHRCDGCSGLDLEPVYF